MFLGKNRGFAGQDSGGINENKKTAVDSLIMISG